MNSVLLIHIAVKVASELRIDPPIHDKNLLSLGPTTLSLVPEGTKPCNYFDNLSGVPGSIVVPPLNTMLEYKSLRTSKSHFMIDWYTISWNAGI